MGPVFIPRVTLQVALAVAAFFEGLTSHENPKSLTTGVPVRADKTRAKFYFPLFGGLG